MATNRLNWTRMLKIRKNSRKARINSSPSLMNQSPCKNSPLATSREISGTGTSWTSLWWSKWLLPLFISNWSSLISSTTGIFTGVTKKVSTRMAPSGKSLTLRHGATLPCTLIIQTHQCMHGTKNKIALIVNMHPTNFKIRTTRPQSFTQLTWTLLSLSFFKYSSWWIFSTWSTAD